MCNFCRFIGNMHELRKCPMCNRRLRLGLYDPGSARCQACTRRLTIAKEIRKHAPGSVQFSVNNTFISQNIPASPGHMDPVLYLHTLFNDIQTALKDALAMHGGIK